jgi:hypothetical protein
LLDLLRKKKAGGHYQEFFSLAAHMNLIEFIGEYTQWKMALTGSHC